MWFRSTPSGAGARRIHDAEVPVAGTDQAPVPEFPYGQFEALYPAFKDPGCRLLVETDIESGLRWGELTEMRVKHLDVATRMLTVDRDHWPSVTCRLPLAACRGLGVAVSVGRTRIHLSGHWVVSGV
jgi:hypothetical protein